MKSIYPRDRSKKKNGWRYSRYFPMPRTINAYTPYTHAAAVTAREKIILVFCRTEHLSAVLLFFADCRNCTAFAITPACSPTCSDMNTKYQCDATRCAARANDAPLPICRKTNTWLEISMPLIIRNTDRKSVV